LSAYLKDAWDLGARGIRARGLSDGVEGTGETETTQENILDWLELYEGDIRLKLLTE
jgi:hypothetical protein